MNEQAKAKNILGDDMAICCTNPMTGFFRDGYCNTNHLDDGTHIVCAVVTEEFLQFSKSRGNDLTKANPNHQFPGLKAGDRWCLCVLRWVEAHKAGLAPKIIPTATHEKILEFVDKDVLEQYYIQCE